MANFAQARRAGFACWMPARARPPISITSPRSDTAGWIWASAIRLGTTRSSTSWGTWRRFPSPTRRSKRPSTSSRWNTLLHPERVLCELGRVLAPGGRFLLVAPLQWEEHQQPHDYGRFTRFALDRMLRQAGFTDISIQPVGGIFRLISRRLVQCAAILSRTLDAGGGGVFRASGAGAAAARPPG